MVFSSLFFLFTYLPVVLFLYYLLPKKYRNLFLLIANLFFYGFSEPIYILIMIASIFIDYTHGLLVQKNRYHSKKAKYFVIQSIVLNLSLLLFFKYYDFILLNLQNIMPIFNNFEPLGLPLPVGISFYTFQTMSYTIDIYRRDAKAQRNLIDFGMYVTLFPQLIAGPIIKYKDVASQLNQRHENIDHFASGIKKFTLGLFKKVLLANNIGMLFDVYKVMPTSELSVIGSWLGIFAFSMQLYFDFSGYSDMAIGLGRMFGFEFLENFNYPYIASSATDFWRRWHMSLSTWFKEYVYIPLGGNRKSQYRNILIVWILTGIWHGAQWNFLLWGCYYAVVLIIEKLFLLKIIHKFPKLCKHIYAIFIIFIGWTIFAIEGNGSEAYHYLSVMFGQGHFIDAQTIYYFQNYLIISIVCIIFSVPLTKKINLPKHLKESITIILVAITLIACTAYLVDASYNPFLYFRF